MKRMWADGTASIRLAPLDFIARLCALVPPPWFNLTRYHGVLASGSPHRAGVVPCVTVVEPPERQLWLPGLEPPRRARPARAPLVAGSLRREGTPGPSSCA
jgi:hypothetical protein